MVGFQLFQTYLVCFIFNVSRASGNRLKTEELINDYETFCLLENYQQDIVAIFIYGIHEVLQPLKLMLLHNNIKWNIDNFLTMDSIFNERNLFYIKPMHRLYDKYTKMQSIEVWNNIL